jgi:NAD(P)-dependent dehydrogenase (short-subunit alcohol dehydrogenase family)
MSQQRQLENKVAVITGGSSGIGKATALAFAKAGAQVVLGARRTDEGEGVARLIRDEGGEAVFVKTDVTDAAQVQALVQTAVNTYGGLDIAFNNAGTEGDRLAPVVEDTPENFKRILEVNVLGVWHAMRAQIPHLVKRGGGAIINNSSVAGRRGFGGFSAYAASKFAVEGLSRSAAQELAEVKIRVNTVAPGPIDTALLDRATGGDHSAFVNFVPMGRPGHADEVAATVTFLASDAAGYITSQSLAVDGGMLP